MHVVIVANGIIEDEGSSRKIAGEADLLLCANGGTRYVLDWGLMPDLVIGDMDSLDAATLERLNAAGVGLVRHSSYKDETDLELALDRAVTEGATRITILGGLGGRIDQMLGNILLLAWPRLAGVRVILQGDRERLFSVSDSVTIQGRRGDLVSLLPLSGEVRGIVTAGLEYPLRGESLSLGPSRGISNVMTADEATVALQDGILLVVHTHA